MPIGSFSKYLSKFTSDHTYQSATFESQASDHKKVVITGMTWDLMNKGRSAAMTGGRTNNPFDIDENDAAYLLRKKVQLRSLLKKIRKWGMDFIFLQEVDIFTISNPRKIAEEQLAAEFFSAIKKLGWKLIHSHKDEDNIIHPLITLYNSNNLEFIAKKGVFKVSSGINRALETEFKHIASGHTVCLTNMYLDNNTDHNKEILSYQQEKITEQKFTIIGGDTNPGENVMYHQLMGDENMATSIASATEVSKKRDVGFMAGPATKDTHVMIKEWQGAYFKLRPRNILLKIYDAKKGKPESTSVFMRVKIKPDAKHLGHTLHQSHIGKPWYRKSVERQQG